MLRAVARALLRPPYWALRTWLETRVLGSVVAEWIWRSRIGSYFTPPTIEAAQHPHRGQILAAAASFEPISSVLECGCNTGANLYLLAQKYPFAHLFGVDISSRAIDIARQSLPKASFRVGRIDDLRRFEDRSVDLTLADAVLMYVGPEKIRVVLQEMVRVARCGLILNEYASRQPPPNYYDHGRFVHNYWSLLTELFPEASFTAQKSAYTGHGWDEYGWLFVLRLRGGADQTEVTSQVFGLEHQGRP